jgi:hypothetical protein
MELLRWSDLGFPKEEGLYHLGGMDLWVDSVRIKQAEEWIASGNDDAVFQLVIPESYAGSLEHRLGELQKGFTRPLG